MSVTNVLHVIDKLTLDESFMHGITRLFSWWIPEHDRERFNVMVVSLRTRDKAGEYLEGLGIRMFYCGRGKFDPRTVADLTRLVTRESVHLLHAHGYGATNFARIAGRISGVPCIVHEHIYDREIPHYQRLADRLLRRQTTRAIAISKSVKEFMQLQRSVPGERIDVIYNGIPVEQFRSEDRPGRGASLKSELGVPVSNRVVTVVGRVHRLKGLTYFLEAARNVLSVRRDVSFLIVGDGELTHALRREVEETGMGEHVRFLGHREDIPRILAATDIKVVASLSEGGPLVLFEAMAAGCGVVATTSCGLTEVMEDRVHGLLVPPRDAAAIARALSDLLDDPGLLERVAAAGHELACRYGNRASVRALEEVYDRLRG